jgi:hypothetical protein
MPTVVANQASIIKSMRFVVGIHMLPPAPTAVAVDFWSVVRYVRYVVPLGNRGVGSFSRIVSSSTAQYAWPDSVRGGLHACICSWIISATLPLS